MEVTRVSISEMVKAFPNELTKAGVSGATVVQESEVKLSPRSRGSSACRARGRAGKRTRREDKRRERSVALSLIGEAGIGFMAVSTSVAGARAGKFGRARGRENGA
jgi:hypothetical protein